MIALYLRTETEAEMIAACPFLRRDDAWRTSITDCHVDVIGHVVTAPAAPDTDGDGLAPPVIDGRFHINLRCSGDVAASIPDALKVAPATPFRVWA